MNDKTDDDEILKENVKRKIIIDFYVSKDIPTELENFKFNVFIRLNAIKITFKNVSFLHCIFDSCYLKNCVFDTCDFTGCRFIGSNFHQTSFRGCKFDFATFERSQLDDDILSEAPREENLRMRFARSLRMNYQQIGNAKAVNKAISLELEATSIYLYKSWRSGERYYKEKYPGLLNGIVQFLKWLEFWLLDFIWGNGESIRKLLSSIILIIFAIAVYDTNTNGSPLNIGFYWSSLQTAVAVFLGTLSPSPSNFTVGVLSFITGVRFVSIALLTALLVKRFSRR
ncbi:pentapeptide repeat-containing protein [Candidatus Methylobacter oryzae]|uniref:Pentapeptide repeat-containing protein n=1 Tax=Candidatus Methylobacter oryzae TaxID=2497749 RepID=A0ABY3CA97_9GAMM|nr:pentapeptide repeat-containing protein [Candidatus Methylobacter oryzae]TRW93110.1 pentapeptide repeat-containing protein [Candidatus Methylobacter oryzae]